MAARTSRSTSSSSVLRLQATLDRIDRKGYGAYKDLQGSYDLREFDLFVDRVQRDPFAPPPSSASAPKTTTSTPLSSRTPYVGWPSRIS